jgi:hypothetical protein
MNSIDLFGASEERKTALLQMAFIIICLHGKKGACNTERFLAFQACVPIKSS